MPHPVNALIPAVLALAALLQPTPTNVQPPLPPTATAGATAIAAPTVVATPGAGATVNVAANTPAKATVPTTATVPAQPTARPSAMATASRVAAGALAASATAAVAGDTTGSRSTAPASEWAGLRPPPWLAPLARLDPSVLAAIALSALALALITLTFAVATWVRARRMGRHYATLMRGVEGQSLTRAVESYVERLNAVERRSTQVGEHGRTTSTRLKQAIQHVGLERYSAVDASDNQQSFSLALLDAGNDGIVLSAIYTRSGLRVYAKPIKGGQSPYALSPEERRAIGRDGDA